MLLFKNRKLQVTASVLFCIGIIFAPGPSSYDTGERFLSEVEQGSMTAPASRSRKLAALSCGAGEVAVMLDWASATIDPRKDVHIVELDAGGTTENKKTKIRLTTSKTGNTSRSEIYLRNGWLNFEANTVPAAEDVIVPSTSFINPAARPSDFPSSFATLELEFLDINMTRFQFTTVFAGSFPDKTPAVRMRCFDDNDDEINQYAYSGDQMVVVGSFAYDEFPSGYGAAFVKSASVSTLPSTNNTPCRKLRVDLSSFTFTDENVGKRQYIRGFPGSGSIKSGSKSSFGDYFSYCAPTAPPAEPSPSPTESVVPPPAPIDGGVQGDPLIMGLAGQLFKFDGTSGGWFSAVSAKSLQWNMRIHEFPGCPASSNTFTTGASFKFFDSVKKTVRTIMVTVVDETKFKAGCVVSGPACLGAGSIELEIDGEKITAPGVYGFNDTSFSDQVVAFNTFHQCSRKWYDFDIVPLDEPDTKSAQRYTRHLASEQHDVFQTIRSIKKTMIDPVVCEEWLEDRQRFRDLFKQEGHCSTILIKTKDISFHIEYKQESERCNAHSLDVWVSSVRREVFGEEWEGVIGETKHPTIGNKYDRVDVLKFDKDEDYKVPSPFSADCKGCFRQK